ncbi:MAG: glycosyltransferase family 4 protein [Chloroflexi bacterium]|nr:glycosyltransferase family 4 protein [Chloroflexota bacterium]
MIKPDSTRILLVISATPDSNLNRKVSEDQSPRKDYVELARALGAKVLFRTDVQRHPLLRLLAGHRSLPVAQAFLAFLRRRDFDIIFTDAENIGLPLALFLKMTRSPQRHVMLGHLLTTRWKRWFLRGMHLHTHIDAIVCHSSLQRWHLIHTLHVPPERVSLLPYQVDERFWRPGDEPLASKICAVGLELRDYSTLIEAVRGLDVHVVIAAASYWSRRKDETEGRTLPSNVTVTRFNYQDLRQLYAECRFVVVPLHECEFQAGITVILEAFAMGKTVIVSQTRGQRDVVRGPHGLPRSDDLPIEPGFPYGATSDHCAAQTGTYVHPHDHNELREAIIYLLNHPDDVAAWGRNGRRFIESTMTLDHFVQRLSRLILNQRSEVIS